MRYRGSAEYPNKKPEIIPSKNKAAEAVHGLPQGANGSDLSLFIGLLGKFASQK